MKNSAGGSLIELLVGCTVVVMLAGLCVHSLSTVRRCAVRTELDLLCMACRHMQQIAIVTQQEQRMVFNSETRSYTYGTAKHTMYPGVIFGYQPRTKGPPVQADTVLTKPITFIDNTIIFYPTSIISAGSLYLSDTEHSCCYALSNGIAHVSLLRGYEYTGEWKSIN